MSSFMNKLVLLIKNVFTSINQLQVAGGNAVQMQVNKDKYCVMFRMSEMRVLLEMIAPFLDDSAMKQVRAFLESIRQKRAKGL